MDKDASINGYVIPIVIVGSNETKVSSQLNTFRTMFWLGASHGKTTCCFNFTLMKLKNMFYCLALCVRSPYIFVNSPYIRCDTFNLTKSKYSQNYRFIFFGLWSKYCDMKIKNMCIVFYRQSQACP